MIFIRSVCLFVALLCVYVNSSASEMYDAQVIKVVDGDTVQIAAPFLPSAFRGMWSVRIYGIDTPEKGARAKCIEEHALAIEATTFLSKLAYNASLVEVSYKDWDKYGGRVLGEIFLDGIAVSDTMIEKGYAVSYHGEQKKSWCS